MSSNDLEDLYPFYPDTFVYNDNDYLVDSPHTPSNQQKEKWDTSKVTESIATAVKIKKRELEDKQIEIDGELEKKTEITKSLNFLKFKQYIANIIYGMDDNLKIQNKVLKKLLNYNLDSYIYNYCKEEMLSIDYSQIAKNEKCLEIIIKGFFKGSRNYRLTTDLVEDIFDITNEVYINIDLDIVYYRVAKIQNFIHNKVNEIDGIGSENKLNRKLMKDLLSVARLHLNINDIKSHNTKSVIGMINKSDKYSYDESHIIEKFELPDGAKYIPNLKSKGMKHLITFNKNNTTTNNILTMDINIDNNLFKQNIMDSLKY